MTKYKKDLKKTCQTCGKVFWVNKGNSKRTRFCSPSCWKEWMRTTYRDDTCIRCGKIFKRTLMSKVKFCSEKCRNEQKREIQRRFWKRNPKRTGHKENCEYCGKEFMTGWKNRKYCSVECKQKNYKKNYYKNRDHKNKLARKYYHRHYEEMKERRKIQYAKHRDKILEYAKNYYRANRKKIAEQIDRANFHKYQRLQEAENE